MKIFYITLLVVVAVAMPLWMAWCRSHKKPYLRNWLASLLFGLPYLAVAMAIPDLLHSESSIINSLTILPLFIGLSAFFGGLFYLIISSNIFSQKTGDQHRSYSSARDNVDVHDYMKTDWKNNWTYSWYRD